MLSDDELARLEALCAAAMSGPWEVESRELAWNAQGYEYFKDRDPAGALAMEHLVLTSWIHGQVKDRVAIFCVAVSPFFEQTQHIHIREENAAFIAAARTALPALLAEVRLGKERFRTYGRHLPSCVPTPGNPCTCGFKESDHA